VKPRDVHMLPLVHLRACVFFSNSLFRKHPHVAAFESSLMGPESSKSVIYWQSHSPCKDS
jgi:hypothetical protein